MTQKNSLMMLRLCACVAAVAAHQSFSSWQQRFGKTYSSEMDEASAASAFAVNLAFIKQINDKNLSYTLGLNKFSGMTHEQWKREMLMPRNISEIDGLMRPKITKPVLADSLDWVNKGGVTPVKDQGQTGDCWAFSDTGSLEGRYFVASGKLLSLSEEYLVDCSTHKGSLHLGLDWVASNGGACSEASYPWAAGKSTCNLAKCTKSVTCNGTVHLPHDVPTIMSELQNGPLSVGLDASALQHYSSGVLDVSDCGTSIDHAVLIVGFGDDSASGKPYWKVKNSWGTDWGEKGYVRIVRNKNMCEMEIAAWYATGVKAAAATHGNQRNPSPNRAYSKKK